MLQVAVLGAGRIGKIHAGNVALNRNAKLVAVADPFGGAAKDLAAQFGCEASLDPLAVIERDDVDAVVVGTPTDTHVPLTLHAVRKGKAVLCEKPIDLDRAKVDDFDTLMVLMGTASGRQCHINCYRDCVYGYDQRFEILGSSGMLLNDNVRPSTVRRWSRTQTEAQEPLLNFFLERYVEAYRTELDLFIKAVEAGEALPTTPHDGRQALRLAECALESALTGRSVKV